MPVYICGTVSFEDATEPDTKFEPSEIVMDYKQRFMHRVSFSLGVAVVDGKVFFKRTHTYNDVNYEQVFGKHAKNGAVACIKYSSHPVKFGEDVDSAIVVK